MKEILVEVPNSRLAGKGEDSDLLSIPNLYDEFTFKTDDVSSCRILVLQVLSP